MTTGAGRPARTEVTPLAPGERASVVRIEMDRGRRHQIRAHLAWLGQGKLGARIGEHLRATLLAEPAPPLSRFRTPTSS